MNFEKSVPGGMVKTKLSVHGFTHVSFFLCNLLASFRNTICIAIPFVCHAAQQVS